MTEFVDDYMHVRDYTRKFSLALARRHVAAA